MSFSRKVWEVCRVCVREGLSRCTFLAHRWRQSASNPQRVNAALSQRVSRFMSQLGELSRFFLKFGFILSSMYIHHSFRKEAHCG